MQPPIDVLYGVRLVKDRSDDSGRAYGMISDIQPDAEIARRQARLYTETSRADRIYFIELTVVRSERIDR